MTPTRWPNISTGCRHNQTCVDKKRNKVLNSSRDTVQGMTRACEEGEEPVLKDHGSNTLPGKVMSHSSGDNGNRKLGVGVGG